MEIASARTISVTTDNVTKVALDTAGGMIKLVT